MEIKLRYDTYDTSDDLTLSRGPLSFDVLTTLNNHRNMLNNFKTTILYVKQGDSTITYDIGHITELTEDEVWVYKDTLIGVKFGTLCKTITREAFRDCTALTSVNIPSSIVSIGEAAFMDCTALTNVTVGEGITSIGASAFKGCTSLSSLTLNNGLLSIGGGAFYGCTSLTSVTIPNSVINISSAAFKDCDNLGLIYALGNTAPTITSSTFVNIAENGTLFTSDAATGYDVWMKEEESYLGYYSWTKDIMVEDEA